MVAVASTISSARVSRVARRGLRVGSGVMLVPLTTMESFKLIPVTRGEARLPCPLD